MDRLAYYLKVVTNRRVMVTLLQGFASGLPLALTSTTLQAWFTLSGVSIITIGSLSLIGQPYVYKFLWSPILDRYVPPLLGRRRGWILVTQMGLVVAIVMMGWLDPGVSPMTLGIVALVTAFLSASQDIAIDAYRTDLLRPEERAWGAALYTGGFRVAMLMSGGLAMVMARYIGWRHTYELMAGLMAIEILVTWWSPDPKNFAAPSSLYNAVIQPLREFLSRDSALLLLVFIVIYKLGDAFALSLTTPFLLKLGFTLLDVGAIYKSVGMMATLLGAFAGGLMLVRLSLFKGLLYFGIVQALSNFVFMWLAVAGKSYFVMVSAIFVENFCGGLATVAFVAFLMALCDHRYTATQFALLTSLSAIGRVYVGPVSGVLVNDFGWLVFYFTSFLAALPGLALLYIIRYRVGLAVLPQKETAHTA